MCEKKENTQEMEMEQRGKINPVREVLYTARSLRKMYSLSVLQALPCVSGQKEVQSRSKRGKGGSGANGELSAEGARASHTLLTLIDAASCSLSRGTLWL